MYDSAVRKLVSSSHHEVYRLNDGWLKVARDNSDHAREELLRELYINEKIGIRSCATKDQGRFAILTEHLGEPLYTWNHDLVEQCLEYMESLPTVEGSFMNAKEWADRVVEKVAFRSKSMLPHLNGIDMSRITGDRLVHTDPHLRNWVKAPSGVRLIDWETGIRSDLDVLKAVMVYFFVFEKQYDFANMVAERITNPETAMMVIHLKSVSNASWAVSKFMEDIDARLNVVYRVKEVISSLR